MDMSSAEARDRLRQAIDDEIKVLEESLRLAKRRRNMLAPISRLPPETLAMIFSFLSSAFGKEAKYLKWLNATRVCHHWRETALSHPYLWGHINFTKLPPVGIASMLARAKMAPLHLEGNFVHWSKAQFEAFERQLEPHIPHTRHLSIFGEFPTGLERLISPAPVLEILSLTNIFHPPLVIPDALFDGIAPKLANLELMGCNISWKSPLLKGLQTLQIRGPSKEARPTLEDWLDALNEMSQLKALTLHSSTPVALDDDMLLSEPQRAVTLPSLTRFHISASAKDCALALAHLVLPALNCLHVAAESNDWDGGDVRLLVPHIARNAHGPQDTSPLQSVVIGGRRSYAEILAWTVPDADAEYLESNTLLDMEVPARLVFKATASATNGEWRGGSDAEIFDGMVERLPMNTISTLLAQNLTTSFSKEVWLRHAPRFAMLKRVCLTRPSVKPFRQMLAEDTPPGGPLRLPSLTKLILDDISLTALRTYHLRDMLIKRKEQGGPLETLDLRTCIASERAIQLLAEIVGDVKGPAETRERGDPALFDWRGGVTFFNKEEERAYDDEYEDGYIPWYDGRDFEDDEEDEDNEEDDDAWDDYDDESDPYDEL